MAVLSEFADDDGSAYYRIRDLSACLLRTQKITNAQAEDLLAVAHRPAARSAEHKTLDLGDTLVVHLPTLRVLSDRTAFSPILDNFIIYLSSEDRDELAAELVAHQTAREAVQTHSQLWDTVAALQKRRLVEWAPLQHVADSEKGEDGEEAEPNGSNVFLDSAKVAQQLQRPLLADDRVLQVVMYSEQRASTSAAYGSDALLRAMLDAAALSINDVARDLHRLMLWRYRFVVIPPAVLGAYAAAAIDSLPGDTLLDVAVYLHDCLRDPGLHCGPEQSDPPMPMAAKFTTAWVHSITTFLADVWADEQYTDDKASLLTRWAASELIPSCPRGLWLSPIGNNLPGMTIKGALQMAMVRFTHVEPERANRGLRLLAEGLGLTHDDFIELAVEAIHAVS